MYREESFTLVELLVVIGILAVLTTAVIIVLNPAEYLSQTRDSRRMQDLSLLNNSLQNLEAIDTSISLGTPLTVYTSLPDDASSTCGSLSLPALPPTYTYNCVTTSNLTKTDGTGWVPVDFSSQSIIQLSSLPIDPVNTPTDGLYYTYIPGGSWELNTILESNKFRTSGSSDRVSNDGGDSYAVYEVGTDKTTSPIKDSNLVQYYKFDTAQSGNIVHNSYVFRDEVSGGSSRAKNSNGTGMAWTTGKLGGGVNFDGADDYIENGSPVSSGALTISAWIKSDVAAFKGIVSDEYNSSDYGYSLEMYTGGVGRFHISNAAEVQYFSGNTSAMSTGDWHHLVGVFNPSTAVQIYLNGVLANQNTTNIPADMEDCQYGGAIGNWYWAVPFDGVIDEVRIYNRALSASEIKAIFDATN